MTSRLTRLLTALSALAFMITLPSHADWRQDADARIEKIRKGDFALHVAGPDGKPIAGAKIEARQTASAFHFGMAVSEGLMMQETEAGQRYRDFITQHFNTLVPENSMKWYATQKETGGEPDYAKADAFIAFAKKHKMAVRGHCIFWGRTKWTQDWVKALDDKAMRAAVETRLESVVTRYRDDVYCWDVNNEMLEDDVFHERLGDGIRAWMFQRAHEIDPDATLFVNEYGILGSDEKLERYLALIESVRKIGAPVSGIGVQEHAAEQFVQTDEKADLEFAERSKHTPLEPAKVLARLDRLAATGLPIHLTEISAKSVSEERRAEALETLFRVGYSHPGVEAILLWGFWEKAHWLGKDAALVDKDWKVLEPGRRLAQLLLETWRTTAQPETNAEGVAKFRGFYGTYEITATSADGSVVKATVDLPPGTTTAEVKLVGPAKND